jgi:hypothetical protein
MASADALAKQNKQSNQRELAYSLGIALPLKHIEPKKLSIHVPPQTL